MYLELCRERDIRQQFPTADIPQFNGVAERRNALIELAGDAAAIQASKMFPSMRVLSGDPLWAAQVYWACHALNTTEITGNPQSIIPYDMWVGKVPPNPLHFLKPGFVKRKQARE